ncbi:MAG: hypothetical protein IBJ02_01975 [Brevundimonas sp.]|nr:hypothetical protein [Brevundimonas sp.]
MRRALLIAAGTTVLAVWPALALAQQQVISSAPERAGVVVYRDRPVNTAELLERSGRTWERLDREGLALIVETRTLDLPAGDSVVQFRGVATGIVTQTATLEGLPGRVSERNTEFNLLSPGSILEHSVGEVVSVVRTNPVTGEQIRRPAIVRAAAGGAVLEIDGRLEALDCSGLTERIIFDRVPEGLGDQPVLSVRTTTPAAGRYTVTLAYLATGLQWSADYVATIHPNGRTLSLTGWITLANFGGTGFPDAPVQVVAGNLNRDDDTVPVDPDRHQISPSCWPQDRTTGVPFGGAIPPPPAHPTLSVALHAPMLDEIVVTGSRVRRDNLVAIQGDLGDYKIYTLPTRTDVRARQTKQVRFLEQDNVRFTRIYRATLSSSDSSDDHAPQRLLRLRNRTRDGLGLPLPGGGVALMERHGGASLFTGEARFDDRPVDLPVELEFGQASDLAVSHETRQLEPTGDRVRYSVTVTVRNDKPEAVEVELAPEESQWRNFRILQSSEPSVVTDAGTPAWRLSVPSGQARELTYTVEFGG